MEANGNLSAIVANMKIGGTSSSSGGSDYACPHVLLNLLNAPCSIIFPKIGTFNRQ